jgi:adenylate kinase family enzyme
MNNKTKETFFKLIKDEISIYEMKEFLIDNIFEIENLFSKNDYFKIVDFDFNNKFSAIELKKIITKYIDNSEYITWEITKTLKNIINKDENIIDCLLDLYNGDLSNFTFLDNLNIYGCRISCYLEEPQYYDKKFIYKDIEENFVDIKTEAEKILKDIEEQNIIILLKSG